LILSLGLSFCGGADGASFAPAAGAMHCGETVDTERIKCQITSVQGGDTITASGESIRLASIHAPELVQAYGPSSAAALQPKWFVVHQVVAPWLQRNGSGAKLIGI
jgi:endonuclease YncB( thermonuclease family)